MTSSHRVARLVAVIALSAAAVPWALQGAAAAAAVSVDAPSAGPSAQVMVSKAAGLGNEAVTVSWSGFAPSSAQQLQNGNDSLDTSTSNPVRVYECRGAVPTSSSECYGSPGFSGIPATPGDPGIPPVPGFTYAGQSDPYANVPDGPANWQDVATANDGTGQVTLQVFTRREAPSLGCDASRDCSLVVVPNYGRDNGEASAENVLDAPWAWARRTVIPLSFLPLDDTCPLGGKPLGIEGSPSSAAALASWRSTACTEATPVTLDYTSINEPQTREDVAAGLSDVGLVTRPLEVDARPTHRLAYAPVALTSVALAFQVDDLQGRPIEHMNLNPRLVAKLVTASYKVADDPGVVGNPSTLFRDPEFRALNSGVAWPGGAPGNHVLLLGDLSDATWTLTRWIDADPTARAFLDGTPDEHGMHVNLAYKGLTLPVSTFPLLDEKQQDSFQPVQGLDHVSRQVSLSQFPGAITDIENGITVVTKPSRQPAGRRETLGIIDTASARAFRIPTASLLNPAGSYVSPTDAAVSAAADTLVTTAQGLREPVSLTAHDTAAYPLLLPVEAVVPTDADPALQAAVVRFLDYALGKGQVPGDQLGQLPDGYLPLTPALRAESLKTRAAVLAGPTPVPSASPTGSPAAEPSAQPTPTATATPTAVPLPTVTSAPPVAIGPPRVVAVITPVIAPLNRLSSGVELKGRSAVIPLVLLVGVTALLVGPAAFVLTRRRLVPHWLQS